MAGQPVSRTVEEYGLATNKVRHGLPSRIVVIGVSGRRRVRMVCVSGRPYRQVVGARSAASAASCLLPSAHVAVITNPAIRHPLVVCTRSKR